jgi:hypothetical protein
LDTPDMQRLRSRLEARYAAEVLSDDPGFVADDPPEVLDA